ncbi:MAG TPA: hypothetical protein VK630_16375, partial [Reyranella sp.]|nr:hypothetical protein [Reyranella sp.]
TMRDETGWLLRLHATSLAPCIQIEGAHHVAEDEGFCLAPGEERIVRLVPVGGTDGWDAKDQYPTQIKLIVVPA